MVDDIDGHFLGFLENSPYSYVEKQDFLSRLATFQATLLRGLPAVTVFLAQYLPFWNEKDFFAEVIWSLLLSTIANFMELNNGEFAQKSLGEWICLLL